jgi:hypothetical protein
MKKTMICLAFAVAIFACSSVIAQDMLIDHRLESAGNTDLMMADNRRKQRRDGRQDNRDDKQDCRQEEGLVGDDKRECKQENRGDGDGVESDQEDVDTEAGA